LACAISEGMNRIDASIIVPVIRRLLTSRAPSLLLKTVHDYYNHTGIEVRNALGQVWRTVGDAHLGGSPETIAMGQLASKASRDAVQEVLSTGGTTRAEVALDYIPDMARLADGTFEQITAFSTDASVWNPVLARSLSPSPATNDLYQMIKNNIGAMTNLYIQEGGRWVRSIVGRVARGVCSATAGASRWVRERVDEVESAPDRLERDIERLYGARH
jgi:hypothetical protein